MRMSDWSSDVCSSDLSWTTSKVQSASVTWASVSHWAWPSAQALESPLATWRWVWARASRLALQLVSPSATSTPRRRSNHPRAMTTATIDGSLRSEEHTTELQSLMRISYAVFCLKNKQQTT